MVDPVPTAEMLLLYANNLKKDLSRISSFNFKNSNIDNNDILEKSSIIADLFLKDFYAVYYIALNFCPLVLLTSLEVFFFELQ